MFWPEQSVSDSLAPLSRHCLLPCSGYHTVPCSRERCPDVWSFKSQPAYPSPSPMCSLLFKIPRPSAPTPDFKQPPAGSICQGNVPKWFSRPLASLPPEPGRGNGCKSLSLSGLSSGWRRRVNPALQVTLSDRRHALGSALSLSWEPMPSEGNPHFGKGLSHRGPGL